MGNVAANHEQSPARCLKAAARQGRGKSSQPLPQTRLTANPGHSRAENALQLAAVRSLRYHADAKTNRRQEERARLFVPFGISSEVHTNPMVQCE
jgi:hypothetical protein